MNDRISYYHSFHKDQVEDIIELQNLAEEFEICVEEVEDDAVIVTGREENIEAAFERLGYGGMLGCDCGHDHNQD